MVNLGSHVPAGPHPGGPVTGAERGLHRGDVVTLAPPRDVHNHGHVAARVPAPNSLILLRADMLPFERAEYDPGLGT